jgi:hypothetical protein
MVSSDKFIGPLESAACLGIMRTFRVYKPTGEHTRFLKIMHAGTAFAGLLGKTIRMSRKQEN